jgi:hypothetical protein
MCFLISEASIGERSAAFQVSEMSVKRAVAERCIDWREQSWSADECSITSLLKSNRINMDRRFISYRASMHTITGSLAHALGQVDRRCRFQARTRSLVINTASGATRV